MSVLSKAMDNLRYRIPPEILQLAFVDDWAQQWRGGPVSLDEKIMARVIRPRVMTEFQVFGGQRVTISLENMPYQQLEQYVWIYEIPMEHLNFREIISVLSVHYMPIYNQMGFTGYGYGNSIMQPVSDGLVAAQRMIDSHSSIPNTSSAQVNLIGQNTIVIRDPFRANRPYHLLCVVSDDPELNNVDYRSQDYVNKLFELAVKSYIYNYLVMKIDRAYLQNGQDLGVVRQYIEGLADSEQMYQDFKTENMGAVMVMNDRPVYTELLRLQINPAI